jgi:hypothetical protein
MLGAAISNLAVSVSVSWCFLIAVPSHPKIDHDVFLVGQPDGAAIICLLRVNSYEGVCAAIGKLRSDASFQNFLSTAMQPLEPTLGCLSLDAG